MRRRTKYLLTVFIGLVASFTIAVSFDYTDTYVADRFHNALESEQFPLDENISLDRFIEYYDWDKVYVILPGQVEPDLSNQFGLPYRHKAVGHDRWSLVFVKDFYVVAEVPIQREVLEVPRHAPQEYYDRWSAFITISEEGGRKYIDFVGH